MRDFRSLSEKEVLALAIFQEDEDSKIYGDFAERLKDDYPATARLFEEMRAEEITHRDQLTEAFRKKFGTHIPLIRKVDVRGFIQRRPIWMMSPLRLEAVRAEAETMEAETKQFYERAAERTSDLDLRQLFLALAEAEKHHENLAEGIRKELVHGKEGEVEEATRDRLFVLRIVQPGLAGLMDGSVSTLAPVFAAAFATHNTWDAFLVGMAASIGAGISMGFAEALSDDGSLTGRGHPWMRGLVCGLMTTAGGIGHTFPYLIADFVTATIVAGLVVLAELGAIAWIRHKYMDTPLFTAAIQVIAGGVLVFISGVLIGSA